MGFLFALSFHDKVKRLFKKSVVFQLPLLREATDILNSLMDIVICCLDADHVVFVPAGVLARISVLFCGQTPS